MSKNTEVAFNPLYEEIETAFKFTSKPNIPKSISDNLKQKLRPYQEDALKNFIFYFKNKNYQNINNKHLLFHMATGSGKTNIVASTILYLYEKGYRDFIFFVNTTNIITKTKHNLLYKNSNKYLFKQMININNKNININIIDETFNDAKKEDINIFFTTIHQLHSNLVTLQKENSITFNSLEDKKLVLIADEAHHLNANTVAKKKHEDSWEKTTQKLLMTNKDNILLEFTATQDMKNTAVFSKYHNKMIYDYPLKEFRNDRYSKEIRLINSDMDYTQRMLLAIMVSEYRQIVAEEKLNQFIKPVILFKNPTNTDNANKNYKDFLKMMEILSISDIDEVFKLSNIKMIDKLFDYIKDDKEKFIQRLKYSFNEKNLILIHSKIKNKDELMQTYLNNLEDEKNHIRVIFAVDILNEGWDVLNLFDIVKLDEAKKSKNSSISEAQLIGRGARYYPFEYKDTNKYKRKFDESTNELKALEEMFFYSINNSEYIASLTKELIRVGLVDGENEERIDLELKESFINTKLYKEGYIYHNESIQRDKEKEVFGINFYYNNENYTLHTKRLNKETNEFLPFNDDLEIKELDYKISDDFCFSTNQNIVRLAINKKPFFYFSSLKKYFPNLLTITQFINDINYLGAIKITVKSVEKQILNDKDKLILVLEILDEIEKKIENNNKNCIGTTSFIPKRISEIILKTKSLKKKEQDKSIRILQPWYVFNPHGGTSEEESFVDFIHSNIDALEKKYDDVKLIRNEKSFAIYDFNKNKNGERFEPDFVLMLKSKKDGCYHQVFCEPKGDGTKDKYDDFKLSSQRWKEDFLENITKLTSEDKIELKCVNENNLKTYENQCYTLYGLPFYNNELKHHFDKEFHELILGDKIK